jgi:hypothetical protein
MVSERGLAQKISKNLEDIKRGQDIERLEKKRVKQSTYSPFLPSHSI